ncbi:MAG: hypothetical protein GY832_16330 [Chloroflexi bacterium]|nr:hypothetical protein [Chloroflexota bacterium]
MKTFENSTKFSIFCDCVLEVGWLLAIIITSMFFDVYSSRVFEPDKVTTLRMLAVVMAAFWVVRLVEEVLSGQRPFRFSWRTPMVLPALLTMTSYLISSILSVAPYKSFMGSYQRLQGTYTLFAYLVIFFAILTSLRTRSQLRRLVTVLILSSLPGALYGMIQRMGLDPLPWGGDVRRRVASTMGNATFLGSYLAMIVPLTIVRVVESVLNIVDGGCKRGINFILTLVYTFIAVVQAIAIIYAGGRGPWFGILAAFFISLYIGLIVMARNGGRRLWIALGSIGLIIVIVIIIFNIPGPLNNRVARIAFLRHTTQFSELRGGTGRVHTLIWQGALDLILPHDPIEYPDGSRDAFNAIRPLVGYGPETMYVVYNKFYPPELGHYESRTAGPDRSHNETLDVLVTTGILGLATYLFTFGGVFYWGLRWLGLIETRRQFWTLVGMSIAFVLLFFLLGWWIEGPHLVGVAVPLGVLAGIIVYLTIQGFLTIGQKRVNAEKALPRLDTILLVGVLSSVVACFVAINVGVVVSATYTTFWVLVGIMVVLGQQWMIETSTEEHDLASEDLTIEYEKEQHE